MTSWVVADSSVMLATVLEEAYTAQADSLLRSWIEQIFFIAAPSLFRYEVVSVIRKRVYCNLLTMDEATDTLERVLRFPMTFVLSEPLLLRAYALATQYNRPTAYDMQYVALAEQLQCEFWTAYEKLINAVNNQVSSIRWIGSNAIVSPTEN
jgi:predicted nucleic acid-binding protein